MSRTAIIGDRFFRLIGGITFAQDLCFRSKTATHLWFAKTPAGAKLPAVTLLRRRFWRGTGDVSVLALS